MLLAIVAIVVGLAFLTLGADRLVAAAARLSHAWGVSPVLIGALVVGFGTSAPEFLVSTIAAARGELELAAGNIIGSNVSNMTLVLGSTALVVPLRSRQEVLRREGVLMLIGVAAFAAALADGMLGFWEGAGLTAGMVGAAVLLTRASRSRAERGEQLDMDDLAATFPSRRREVLTGLVSLAVTLAGAELLVRGATMLAGELDLSSGVVGLTIVAIGTSLPELATALAAARRREADLVIGNVLGSNLFNSLGVGGVSGLVGGGAVTGAFGFPLTVMVVTSVAAGLFAFSGSRLVRNEGLVLLAAFVVFVAVAF